jgi:hypothetical protein
MGGDGLTGVQAGEWAMCMGMRGLHLGVLLMCSSCTGCLPYSQCCSVQHMPRGIVSATTASYGATPAVILSRWTDPQAHSEDSDSNRHTQSRMTPTIALQQTPRASQADRHTAACIQAVQDAHISNTPRHECVQLLHRAKTPQWQACIQCMITQT